MQYLKKARNYWRKVDKRTWPDKIRGAVWGVLLVLGYLLLTMWVLWGSYDCFDLRHPMYGKNFYYVGIWERMVYGCVLGGVGILLVVFGIGQIPEMWPHSAVASPVARVKKLYSRGKNRFKPTNRKNRQ